MGNAQKEIKMKLLVLFLGSTTLVAGSTSITSQQDVHADFTHLLPHQPANTRMVGDGCPWVEPPIFDTVAHPLIANDCDNLWFSSHSGVGNTIDLDGDGVPESMAGNVVRWELPNGIDSPACKTRYVPNSNPTAISNEIFLSVNPKYLTYKGSAPKFYCSLVGYLDVTNDGKPDAIISGEIGNGEWNDGLWFVENISDWPATCATDINSDGSTNVNDLLEVVGNWGSCE